MPLQIPVTQTGLEASIQQAMKNAGRNAQINLGTNSRQINALAQPLGRITGQADEFTKSMEAANARVFAFGASVGIINGVSKAFGALVKNTIEVEKSLVEINTVLNTSGDSLQKFGNKLFDVAKTTGQTFDVVAKGALELARQGLSTEETLKRINDALILSRLSGLDAQQSVEGLTAAFNSFKDTGITTSQILNKLVVVSQKYSVSERDLIEGLKRSASVADQAGVSFDELVGIITTVQERTARGGAVIGNAFKTIFARIQDTGALQDLANLGIQVTDLEGKVLPATRILQNLGAEFNNLSQLEQADIAKKLGGVYQLSNLLAAVKDLSSEQSKYNDIVQLSAGATNEAYQKNAALNETLTALINKVSVSAQQLGATLGAIGITDNLKSLLSFFNNILEGIQKILGEESALGTFVQGLAKGIGNVLAGPGLALFGAIIAKLSKDLISFGLESLKSFFKIGQSAKEIASVEKSIAAALGSNLTLQRQLFALEGNRAAQIKLMTDAIVQQEAVMRRMASTAGSLAGPLYQQGVRSSGGQGLRVPKAAGGYMPAVSQESRDISRGVGGAKAGDKPVVIPNFAFGGGKRGTMVAHTGEFIVPNFAAGGSAIFNRDMVRSMGLPAGAQKIGAAGGFVPNFASLETQSTKVLEKYAAGIGRDITPEKQNAAKAILQQRKGSKLPLDQLIPINKSGKDFAMIVGMKGVKDFQNRFGDDQGRITSTQTEKSRYLISVPIRGIQNKELQFKESKKINEELSEIAGKEALQMAKALSGGAMPNPDNLKSIKESLNPGALAGTAGTIFEAAISGILNDDDFKDYSKIDRNSLIDFPPFDAIKKLFGIKGGASKGLEAKATNSSDLISSAAGKFLKNAKGAEAFSGRGANIANALNKAVVASVGYIPNFADPLKEAIGREMSAGVPASQIYIDQNSSLKNSMNPMGLMVANRRDEPAGGMQGINRARREGANPMTYGAGSGFIPNYAVARDPVTGRFVKASDVSTTSGGVDIEKPKRDLLGVLFLVQTGLSLFNGATADATSGLGKLGNAIGSVASAASTVALVGQGLSGLAKEGSVASAVLGKIGIYGAVAAGAFEAFKQVGVYLDSTNNSINKAQGSMERVADAASKAAVNLNTLKPSQQEKIRQSREALISGATTIKTPSSGTLESIANYLQGIEQERVVNFEGVSGDLEKSFNQTIDQALAVGVSYTTMWNMIKEASKSGSKITADEVNKISQEIERLIETAAKFKPEDLIKDFGLKPGEGLGQKLINETPQQIQSFIQGNSEESKELRDYFSGKGIAGKIAIAENLQDVIDLLKQQDEAQQETSKNAVEGISKQTKELLKQLKVQQLINERKRGEAVVSKSAELANLQQSLAISSDLSLSETQRATASAKLETAYSRVTKELEAAAQIGDELDNVIKNFSDESEKITTNLQPDQIKNGIEKAKVAMDSFGKSADEAKLVADAIAEGGIKGGTAYEKLAEAVKGKLSPEFGKIPAAVDLAVQGTLNLNSAREKILTTLNDEIYSMQRLANLNLKVKQIEEDRRDIVERVNYNLESRAGELDYRAGQISNTTSLNQARKEVETAIYEKTNIATSTEDYKKGLDEINQKYFDLEQAAALKKAEIEAKANLIRNSKVDENSIKIGDNTKALTDFYGILQNDIKNLLQTMPTEIKKAIEEANIQPVGGNNVNNVSSDVSLSPLERQKQVAVNTKGASTAANTNNGSNIGYNLGSSRPNVPNYNLIAEISKMVRDMYGDTAKAVITSGRGEYGSRRHRGGEAADLYVEIGGKRIQGEDLAKLGANWVTQGKGSAGYGMSGGSVIHLDTFTKDKLRGNEGLSWGYEKSTPGSTSIIRNLINQMGGGSGLTVNQTAKQITAQQFGLTDQQAGIAKKLSGLEVEQIGPAALKAAEDLAKQYGKSNEEVKKIADGIKNMAIELKTAEDNFSLEEDKENARKIKEYFDSLPKTFGKSFSDSVMKMRTETTFFQERLGEAIPTLFADNLAQGIQDAVTGTKSLEDALLNAASSFVSEIQSMTIKNLANTFTSSVFGFSQGGEVKKYASGGMINGGSGSKDDVPAMLMGGEYVINKKSVQKYGPDFLHAINNGSLSGYAKGGKVEDLPMQSGGGDFYIPGTYGQGGIQGRENLLAFAKQGYTSGQYDVMQSGEGYASINLEAESARLTNFGRRFGPQAEAVRSAKLQAFDLYEQEIRQEEEWRKQVEEAKKQAKAERKAMLVQIGLAVASSIASSAGNSMIQGAKAGWSNAASQAGSTFSSKALGAIGGAFKGGTINGVNVGGLGNWVSGVGSAFTGNFKQAGNYFKLSQIGSADQLQQAFASSTTNKTPFASFLQERGFSPNVSSGSVQPSIGSNGVLNWGGTSGGRSTAGGRSFVEPPLPEVDPSQWTRGGPSTALDSPPPLSVPVTSDSGVKDNWQRLLNKPYAIGGQIPNTGGVDTVPAMLSGGEFIMNRAASQNIGAGNLQALNAGAGSLPTEEKTEELNDKLIAKLDELIVVMTEGGSGAGSITINVDSNGKSTEETSGESSESKQRLAKQIKDTVMKVIEQEKRLGGKLRRSL